MRGGLQLKMSHEGLYSRGIILGGLAFLLSSFQALPVDWPLLGIP